MDCHLDQVEFSGHWDQGIAVRGLSVVLLQFLWCFLPHMLSCYHALMFSCSHGCQMRALGLDKESCNMMCDRNGQSGCFPTVNGYKFNLCKSCSREGCAKWPKVEECEVGCNSYDGM